MALAATVCPIHLINFRTALIGATSGSIGSFFNEIGGLAVLWVGAYLVLEGKLTIGQLIAFRIISGNVLALLFGGRYLADHSIVANLNREAC